MAPFPPSSLLFTIQHSCNSLIPVLMQQSSGSQQTFVCAHSTSPKPLCCPTGPSITEIWMGFCPTGLMSYWVFCESSLLVVRTHHWFWTGARHSCLCGEVTKQPSPVCACVEACGVLTRPPETLDNRARRWKNASKWRLKKRGKNYSLKLRNILGDQTF